MRDVVGASTSLGAASISWLSTFNEIVQIVAGLVAILAGLITIIPWIKRKFKKHEHR